MASLAILAGGGRLPLLIAESITARGESVHLIAIRGEAGPEIERYPHTWVNWGQIGRAIGACKTHGNGTLVIAGRVSRPDLLTVRPDFGLIQNIPTITRILSAGGDNRILTRVIALFESQGLTVKGVHEVAPELVAALGTGISSTLPLETAHDIELGTHILSTLSDLDIGQAAVIADGNVIAIEGVDGTDRMLARLASNTPSVRQGVLIKAPKAGQELRVDMPTIGPDTVSGAAAAGLTAIAVAIGQVLILDRAEVERRARDLGVSLHIVHLDTVARTHIDTAHVHVRQLGRHRPSRADLADVETGVSAVTRLARFKTGAAAAVIREHVLAIAATETPDALAARVASLHQWGSKRLPSTRGALTVRIDDAADAAMLQALLPHLTQAKIAGLAVASAASTRQELPIALITAADAAGLFVVDTCPPLFRASGAP